MSVLAGCAVPRIPPMGHEGRAFQPDADERAMWRQAEQEEAKLLEIAKVYQDPLLEDYLSQVASTLMPPEAKAAGAPPIRITVFRDPTINAFAMPNGAIFIHSGLLARVENEAQLAAIVGHEIVHVTHRHTLQLQRNAQARWLFAPSATDATPHRFLGLPLAHRAAVSGFGKTLEREADVASLARMVEVGYDPREAPTVFELLQQQYGDPVTLETFLFGNASWLAERIASTQAVVHTHYASLHADALGGDTAAFARRIRVLVRENAALDIRAGRFGLARAQLDRVLPLAPSDPVTHLYYGDLHRLRAQWLKGDEDRTLLLAEARAAYERAAQLDPAYADPYRRLGLLYFQGQERDKAVEAFRRYLALSPDGEDARRVREYLVELER